VPSSAPGRRWTALAWTAALACACLFGQVGTAPAAPVRPGCDPVAGPLIAVDGLLRCEAVVACDGGPVVAGDAFAAADGCVVRTGRMAPADIEALALPVDLTTASEAELASLPGIGPALARRIAAARPLHHVDEQLRVDGIGPARLAAIRPRARVGGPAPTR
jgi:hypothetical protein